MLDCLPGKKCDSESEEEEELRQRLCHYLLHQLLHALRLLGNVCKLHTPTQRETRLVYTELD